MRKINMKGYTFVMALAFCMQAAHADFLGTISEIKHALGTESQRTDLLNDMTKAKKLLFSDDHSSSTTTDHSTAVSALKQAVEVSARRAVDEVSKTNGFLDNAQIHIPLPPQVIQAGSLMRKFGMGSLADQFEDSMNHAAEKAAPKATAIIVDAVKNMTIDDANQILHGADDAATQYFKKNTSAQLTQLFRPSIEDSLSQTGSTKYYKQLDGKLSAIPVIGKQLNVNLPDYVTQQALNGLFVMIAAEEKKIRDDPMARTTELLKQAFGHN